MVRNRKDQLVVTDEMRADGWIEHSGGICPVETDVLVNYQIRSGWRSDGAVTAGLCRWDHGRTPESANNPSLRRNDIIAYKPEPS